MANDSSIILLDSLLVSDHPDLPPLPVDEKGRHVSWAICMQEPSFYKNGREIAVTPEWIDERIRLFHKVRSPDWTQPILDSHDGTGDGEGDFLDMRRIVYDGKITCIAAAAWDDPDAAAKIASGKMSHVSIGLYPIELYETGEFLSHVPMELSKTKLPHLQYARILCSGASRMPTMPTHLKLKAATIADTLAQIRALVDAIAPDIAAIEELKALGAELVGAEAGAEVEAEPVEAVEVEPEAEATMATEPVAPEEPKPEEEEEPITMSTLPTPDTETAILLSRLASVEAELAAERAERERLDFVAAFPLGGTITLTEAAQAVLLTAYRADRQGFRIIEGAISRPGAVEAPADDAAPTLATPPAPTVDDRSWLRSIGGSAQLSVEPAGPPKDRAEAAALAVTLAKANGTTPVTELGKIYDTMQMGVKR